MFGFVNINKPCNISSASVCYRLRKLLKIKQIGHCGTLDPLANGVLPIAIGKATRLIEFLPCNKSYIAGLQLGKVSNTYDIEGQILDYSNKKIGKNEIEENLKRFIGKTHQRVPMFSAVKRNGCPLYKLAREKRIDISDLPTREIQVDEIKLLEFDEKLQRGKIDIKCESGTYIRSIINDLGQNLGVGAIMTNLLRYKSNGFCIDESIDLDKINIESIDKRLINPLDVLELQIISIDDVILKKIRFGQQLHIKDFKEKLNSYIKINELILLKYSDKLSAVGRFETENVIKLEKVFV